MVCNTYLRLEDRSELTKGGVAEDAPVAVN